MNPRDLFEVAVRTLGAVELVCGVWDLVNSALFYTNYFTNPDVTFRYYLLAGWANIFVGLLFIRAGGVLVNFAYPESLAEEERELPDDNRKNTDE